MQISGSFNGLQVLTKRTVYLPNLRAAVAQIRKFSWHRDGENMDSYKMVRDADAGMLAYWKHL